MPKEITSSNMNRMLLGVDKLLTQQLSSQSQSKQDLKVAKQAMMRMSRIFNAYKRKPFNLEENSITSVSKLVFDLHLSKVDALSNKENAKEYAKVAKSVEQCLSKTLAVFYPEADKTQIKIGGLIFEEMVQSILTDVQEEVVGQERMPGAIPRLVERNLKFKHGIEGSEEIRKTAALLYPIALLAASYDPKVRIPSLISQDEQLHRDMYQFENEYRSQFGGYCSDLWTPDKFGDSLKRVWEARRKQI